MGVGAVTLMALQDFHSPEGRLKIGRSGRGCQGLSVRVAVASSIARSHAEVEHAGEVLTQIAGEDRLVMGNAVTQLTDRVEVVVDPTAQESNSASR
jgi:hypothetical protein